MAFCSGAFQVGRRDFLKGSLAGTTAFALSGVADVTVDSTVYKDGVYEGVGTGRNGEIKVAVTVADGKISGVEILSHSESADIGALALPKLAGQAVAANSAAIDGASGATMTSEGFRQALELSN